VDPLAWHAAFGDSDDEDLVRGCAVCTGSGDHAFARAEFHFAWSEVGDADDEFADELFGLVGFFDSGEDVLGRAAAEAER